MARVLDETEVGCSCRFGTVGFNHHRRPLGFGFGVMRGSHMLEGCYEGSLTKDLNFLPRRIPRHS